MTQIKQTGYAIFPKNGEAIYGTGETVDQAWAEVVDGVGVFFDAYGNDIPADQAYETQFETHGATADLIAQVNAEGGSIEFRVVGGVCCTVEEDERAYA